MQKTLTYYDNQSRQIYDIINPPIKYIYFQFPIESNVIAILKVHDKSTLFHGRKREREKERIDVYQLSRQIRNIMDKASNKRGKKQKKKKKEYEKKKKEKGTIREATNAKVFSYRG